MSQKGRDRILPASLMAWMTLERKFSHNFLHLNFRKSYFFFPTFSHQPEPFPPESECNSQNTFIYNDTNTVRFLLLNYYVTICQAERKGADVPCVQVWSNGIVSKWSKAQLGKENRAKGFLAGLLISLIIIQNMLEMVRKTTFSTYGIILISKLCYRNNLERLPQY